MELKGISGGKDFSIVKFKDKIGSATKYNSLKNKRENIVKVVRNSQNAIRGGRFKVPEAMAKLKALDGNLSFDETRDIKKVFQQLGSVPKPSSEQTSLQKAVAAAEAKHDAKHAEINKLKPGTTHPSLARINRDPSSYLDDRAKQVQERTGLASGSVSSGGHYNVGANRGQTLDKQLETRDVSGSAEHQRLNL